MSELSRVFLQLLSQKTESCLLATRLLTLYFTLSTVLPLFVASSQSAFQKALLSSASTSALRLHQRLPPFTFSRHYLALVLNEDSAHYLLFALIFALGQPLSLALLPVVLFAALHSTSFLASLLSSESSLGRRMTSFVELYQRAILQTVALTEIVLMPTLVVAVIGGTASLLAPIVYFRFLGLRYVSRRNPYTRQVFHEMRLWTESAVARPNCPSFVRRVCLTTIDVICRLSPQISSQ